MAFELQAWLPTGQAGGRRQKGVFPQLLPVIPWEVTQLLSFICVTSVPSGTRARC